MDTTLIIMLSAVLFVIIALEVFVLLRGKKCGHKSARRAARERNLKRKWRVACIDWWPKLEMFNFDEELLRYVAGIPEPYRSKVERMNHEASDTASRFASLALRRKDLSRGERRELRRVWNWLRVRGLLSLGFASLRGQREQENR